MGLTWDKMKAGMTGGGSSGSGSPTDPDAAPIGPAETPATVAQNNSQGLQPGGKNTTGPQPGKWDWLKQGVGTGVAQGFQNYQSQRDRINKRGLYGQY